MLCRLHLATARGFADVCAALSGHEAFAGQAVMDNFGRTVHAMRNEPVLKDRGVQTMQIPKSVPNKAPKATAKPHGVKWESLAKWTSHLQKIQDESGHAQGGKAANPDQPDVQDACANSAEDAQLTRSSIQLFGPRGSDIGVSPSSTNNPQVRKPEEVQPQQATILPGAIAATSAEDIASQLGHEHTNGRQVAWQPSSQDRGERLSTAGQSGQTSNQHIDERLSTASESRQPANQDRNELFSTAGQYGQRASQDRGERLSTAGQSGQPSSQDRGERLSTAGQSGQPASQDRDEKPSTAGQSGQPASQDRDEKPSTAGQSGQPSSQDRDEKPSTAGQSGQPARQGRDEKPSTAWQSGQPSSQDRDKKPSIAGQSGQPAGQDRGERLSIAGHSEQRASQETAKQKETLDVNGVMVREVESSKSSAAEDGGRTMTAPATRIAEDEIQPNDGRKTGPSLAEDPQNQINTKSNSVTDASPEATGEDATDLGKAASTDVVGEKAPGDAPTNATDQPTLGSEEMDAKHAQEVPFQQRLACML